MLEWFFVSVATLTIAGIAAMSVERFVFIHRTFSPDFNDSMGSGLGYDYGLSEGSGEGSGGSDPIQCSHWSCLNDFTFALLILVNWGESKTLSDAELFCILLILVCTVKF